MGSTKQKRRPSFQTQPDMCFITHVNHAFVWDLTVPWVFAAVASIIPPIAILLNALIIINSSKTKERTAESYQCLAIKVWPLQIF